MSAEALRMLDGLARGHADAGLEVDATEAFAADDTGLVTPITWDVHEWECFKGDAKDFVLVRTGDTPDLPAGWSRPDGKTVCCPFHTRAWTSVFARWMNG